MKTNPLAAALAAASETDKAELAHGLAQALAASPAGEGEGSARVRALVAAMDRFVAESETGGLAPPRSSGEGALGPMVSEPEGGDADGVDMDGDEDTGGDGAGGTERG